MTLKLEGCEKSKVALTTRPVPEETRGDLVAQTLPLFLECGKQIAPQFRIVDWFVDPPDERHRDFVARVREEGSVLYRQSKVS